MKPAISVHNLSKEYRLGLARTKGNNLTENLRYQTREIWDKVTRLVKPNKAFTKEESFWALKDVSFEVQPGEVVGIIGRNGAGKSTLLKVLSQIVEPTSGHAVVRGRMGSLLEVGTGFHQELTGRENIFMNGAILGMKRAEINRKFDEIVAFAEIEKFLDTPVKRYSSGMYVRLAFAVAAHLEPEILIVDEVLAVGDAGFQKKCLGKMQEVGKSGKTVLFVSHNLNAVKHLCNTAIVLQKGGIRFHGHVNEAFECYNNDVPHHSRIVFENHETNTSGIIKLIDLYDDNNSPSAVFMPDSIITLSFELEPSYTIHEPRIGIGITNSTGDRICAVASYLSPTPLGIISNGTRITCRFRVPALLPGLYYLDIGLNDGSGPFLQAIYSACAIEIAECNYLKTANAIFPEMGHVMVRSEWSKTDVTGVNI